MEYVWECVDIVGFVGVCEGIVGLCGGIGIVECGICGCV